MSTQTTPSGKKQQQSTNQAPPKQPNRQEQYNKLYPKGNKDTKLKKGDRAPEFCLKTTPDQSVSLSDCRGQPVVVAFYPADWSPVCGDQMSFYNEILPEFQKFNAELIGISVDGVWCHGAFARDRKLHFPLLSDFEPKGGMARAYGVYREADGVTERALFVIDGDGVIQWSHISPIGVNPGANGILSALEELQNKGEKQHETVH
jgi:peroxiredoxin